jgi:hypothetical protein
VNRYRFDADPEPDSSFHVVADPDLNPDWHKNDADPTPSSTLLVTAMPVYNVLSFSLVSVCHNFGQLIEISGENNLTYQLFAFRTVKKYSTRDTNPLKSAFTLNVILLFVLYRRYRYSLTVKQNFAQLTVQYIELRKFVLNTAWVPRK